MSIYQSFHLVKSVNWGKPSTLPSGLTITKLEIKQGVYGTNEVTTVVDISLVSAEPLEIQIDEGAAFVGKTGS